MAKRKRGTGGVSLRKDGRWEGRVVIAYDDNGLPMTKNVLAITKMECLEKLEKLSGEVFNVTDKNLNSDMLFGEWIDYWYVNFCKLGLRETTQATYEQRIYKQIIPKIGKVPLNTLTSNKIDKFYAHLKTNGRLIRRDIYGKGLSNSVIRSIHAHIRSSLDKAVELKLIKNNPATYCKLPSKNGTEIDVLTKEEMQRLLIQAKEEGFYEMFLLDLSTGMRRGELLALKWDDINFETRELKINKQVYFKNGKINIIKPKTKASNRSIILPPPLVEVLKEYKATVNSQWLFPSPVKEDAPRDPTACRKKLSQILEHAGCKHVRFHALRHIFATHALQYGMDIKTLATTLGHSSVEVTLDTYSHTTEDMQISAARKIDTALGNLDSKNEAVSQTSSQNEEVSNQAPQKPKQAKFEPYRGKIRKPGTGCISQINENLWEGRYSPTINGKRVARNVYAHSREECEVILAEMIKEMKKENNK